MQSVEIGSDGGGREEVVAVLAVCEVVGGEVGAGHNDRVVDAVELHVLQAPTFVEAIWNGAFLETGEVRRVVHADFNTGWELGDEGREKGGGCRIRGFAGPAKGIGEDGDLEVGVQAQRLRDCVNLRASASGRYGAEEGARTSSCSDLPM